MGLQQERDRIAKENKKYIAKLHPKVRDKFTAFEAEARANDLDLKIFSSLRSIATQQRLYDNYKSGKSTIPAARPGWSMHNYGFAIDTYVLRLSTGTWAKYKDLYKKLLPIANKYGLYWLGSAMNSEIHHWEFNNGIVPAKGFVVKLRALKAEGKVDSAGYVLLDKINTIDPASSSKLTEEWSTDLLSQSIGSSEQQVEQRKKQQPRVITNVEEINAVGIWQIVKLVADQYSLSQNINDATIAFDQGSLLNFVKKVVQEPWLQFFGDTVNDQYYFQVRKEPFDYNGWNAGMIVNDTIKIEDVLSDDLSWYDGPVYSWFQIIPKGSFLGEQDLIFQHVAAVFFEEYAEVWGSKPLSHVSNYLNFIKISDGKIMLEKAIEDLRYMVESNVYLPFTRSGTITIKGDYRHRRGQKIQYLPTGEEFYVDSVSHSYQISDNGPVFLTTLRVSRGMVMKYLGAPEDANTNSYWNLILYSDPPPTVVDYPEKVAKKSVQVYFDNDRAYLIIPKESWPPSKDTRDKKMERQIKEFPGLRQQLYESNIINTDKAAALINEFPNAPLECVGYVDSDKGGKTPVLAINRAKTLRRAVIDRHMEIFNTMTREQLENKISIRGAKFTKYDPDGIITNEKVPSREEIEKTDNADKLKIKSLERFAEFVVKEHTVNKKKSVPQEGIGWKVNDPVFQFFLRRKQQNEC
jgi:hypothetical protein